MTLSRKKFNPPVLVTGLFGGLIYFITLPYHSAHSDFIFYTAFHSYFRVELVAKTFSPSSRCRRWRQNSHPDLIRGEGSWFMKRSLS